LAPALAFVEVASGLAVWKPVQLEWLAILFGGYDGARLGARRLPERQPTERRPRRDDAVERARPGDPPVEWFAGT